MHQLSSRRQACVAARNRPNQAAQHTCRLHGPVYRQHTMLARYQRAADHQHAPSSAVGRQSGAKGQVVQQQQQQQHPAPAQAVGQALPDEAVRVVGLGQRGISAAARLMSNDSLQGAEFWMLDTDAKVLSSSNGPNCIQLPMEDDAQLTQQQLERLAGKAIHPEAGAGGAAVGSGGAGGSRSGLSFPITSSGVAYLMGAAGGVPGGSKLVLQLAAHLRRAGFFVLAALTLPFDFEGRRKVEEAAALVEALQDVANLVVVVPQGVLVRASTQLTVTQALEIADMTLETSCRAIQWALNVPEVLLASAGGMLWHGRDLRLYRRLLSPPMELLGTCPGAGHVGRGFASMPVQHLSEAGLASGLSTLAETAVVAAADSPFLDNLLSSASGVLCVLSLPERVMSHDLDMSPGALNDPEKYAIRAAVQVAASMVMDLVGSRCDEVVACAFIRSDWPHKDPTELCMEATLLVVEDPAAAEEKEDSQGSQGMSKAAPGSGPTTPAATAAARFGTKRLSSGPILHPALLKQQPQQQPQQQQPPRQQQGNTNTNKQQQQQPSATNKEAPGASTQQQQPEQQQQQQSATPKPGQGSGWSRSRSWQQPRSKERLPYEPASASSGVSGGRTATTSTSSSSQAATPPAAPRHATAPQQQPKQHQPPQAPPPAGPPQQSPGSSDSVDSSAGGGQVHLLPRMADKFVDTMVAQSLDLPPSAARWRQHQRKQNEQKQAARRASGHFPVASIPWASNSGNNGGSGGGGSGGSNRQQLGAAGLGGAGGGGGAPSVEDIVAGVQDVWEDEVLAPPRDVKSRVAGMLQKERLTEGGNSWEDEEDEEGLRQQ